jgi:hypothetical protein
MLPNIYEPYEVERIDSREWYTTPGGTVPYLWDLFCCPCDTQTLVSNWPYTPLNPSN